jgi:23S rRNA pseudouridine2605 synthase
VNKKGSYQPRGGQTGKRSSGRRPVSESRKPGPDRGEKAAAGKPVPAGQAHPAERKAATGKAVPAGKPGPDRRKAHAGKPVPSGRKMAAGSRSGAGNGEKAIRLNRFIAASGICSRREADQLISAGLVTVNGKNITELGTRVNPGDDVRYNGKRIRNERKVYLLLNKPRDYVTTTDDPKERKTVMRLVEKACSERIYPVGRLDRQTTGVLLFTNDGDLAKRLTHPSYNKKKIYHVFLDRGMSAGDLRKLAEGITLEDGFIQPDAISYVSDEHRKEVGLEIHSGRNRVVRRMFEHMGYRVTKLDRVYFAGLTKKNLPRGKWRFLTDTEVNRLKMNAYE